MERSPEGEANRLSILDSEDDAEQLALELLAPQLIVTKRLETSGIRWREDSALNMCVTLLVTEFGLPFEIATRYANMLVMSRRPARCFREWLGIKIGVIAT